MTGSSSGIGIYLIHQLDDRLLAISYNVRRVAPGGGDHSVANDQQAKVVAGNEALDHHFVTEFRCGSVCDFKMLAAFDVDRDAFALVAITRFDDDGQADFAGSSPGISRVADGGLRAPVRPPPPGVSW